MSMFSLQKPWKAFTIVSALVVFAVASYGAPIGDPLLVGDTDLFPSLLSPPAEVLQASQIVPYSVTGTGTHNSGNIVEAVYLRDGTLDFYYQIISLSSAGAAVTRMEFTNFTNFLTSVFVRNDGGSLPSDPGFQPNGNPTPSADRPQASTVGFSFFPPTSNALTQGQHSQVLVISTDATQFTTSPVSVGIIGAGGGTFSGYTPTAAIPEPVSMALIGAGLIGLGFVRKFRRA